MQHRRFPMTFTTCKDEGLSKATWTGPDGVSIAWQFLLPSKRGNIKGIIIISDVIS